MKSKLQQFTYQARLQGTAIYIVYNDPKTPWYAKFIAALVVIQIFNPVDILPDFIPILGYLDDLILVPAGIWLVWKLVPPEVHRTSLESATKYIQNNPKLPKLYSIILFATAIIFTVVVIWVIIRLFKSSKSE